MASIKRSLSSAEEIYQGSVCIKEGLPSINDPGPKHRNIETLKYNFPVYEFGEQGLHVPHKTVLLVGESGAGKSTLINALLHFIFGVSWLDRFRFNCIKEIRGRRKTQIVTVYTIHHKDRHSIPFSLTLIDTPGFGDNSKGLTDDMIVEQLKSFLNETDETGISHIDSVGFVIPSCRQKLTASEESTYKMLEDLFGKDIKSKINFLLPFADLNILAQYAVKDSSFFDPSFKYFTFNNSALTKQKDEKEDELEEELGQLFWEKNNKEYKKFLNSMNTPNEDGAISNKEHSLSTQNKSDALNRCQEKDVPNIQGQSLICLCRGVLKQSKSKELIKELLEEKKQKQNKCPITMQKNWRRYVATVSHGKAGTLQAPNSDVSLKIPKGSPGVFVSRVHTDYTRVRDVVPDSECVVGPFVEFGHLGKGTKEDKLPQGWYEIKIPHCVEDKAQWKNIKVRKGSIFSGKIFIEVPRRNESSNDSTYYDVNEKFITIFTKHFCHFTCSACNYSCYASAKIYLFGNLETSRHYKETLVRIKVFLCSKLLSIRDFEKELIDQQQQRFQMKILKEDSIHFDKNSDPQKSRVTLSIGAQKRGNQLAWCPSVSNYSLWNEHDEKFTSDKPIPAVIDLDGCHICRNTIPMMPAMTVQMTTDQETNEFHGTFRILAYMPPVQMSILAQLWELFMHKLGVRPQRREIPNPPEAAFLFRVAKGSVHAQLKDTENQVDTHRQVQSFRDQSGINNNNLVVKLSDQHLVELSNLITSPTDLRELGTALGLKHHEYTAAHVNNISDITSAAHAMLLKWLKRQNDEYSAWNELKAALNKANLTFYISKLEKLSPQ